MFHVKHEGWPGDLTDEALEGLRRYAALLRSKAVPRGMIARSDRADLETRHIRDSLRAVGAIDPGTARAVDLGSGAGLPGVPLAVAMPSLEIVLAEARRTRIAFLELVVEELGLENATIHAGRVEMLPRAFDVALARGFGDPRASWRSARQVLLEHGRLLYWAGSSFDAAADAPSGVRVDVGDLPDLESRGPIVIMARQ